MEFGIPGATEQERKMLVDDDVLLWRSIFLFMVAKYISDAKEGNDVPLFLLGAAKLPEAVQPGGSQLLGYKGMAGSPE